MFGEVADVMFQTLRRGWRSPSAAERCGRLYWNISRERWALLRKEYAAWLECTNSVEDSLRNMSLADMSYGADVVKSMSTHSATS